MNINGANSMRFLEHDFIIVGSGPTGLVIAEKLLKLNKKILIIDDKEKLNNFEEKIDSQRIIGNRYMGHYFGGNALAWEFQNGVFQESEFSFPFLKIFSRDKLKKSISNIEAKLDIKLGESNRYRTNPNINYSSGNTNIESVNTNIAQKKSWVELFKDSLMDNNLDYLFAKLTSIKVSNKRAYEVEFNETNTARISEGSVIILCCGTLGNAKILQNIKNDYGKPNKFDVVLQGGIADHPMFETIDFYNTGTKKLIRPVFYSGLFHNRKLKRKYLVRNNDKILGLFEIRMNFHYPNRKKFYITIAKIGNRFSSFFCDAYLFKPDTLTIWIQLVQSSELNFNSNASIGADLKTSLNEKDLENYHFIENAILNFMNDHLFELKSKVEINNISDLNANSRPAYHLSGSTQFTGKVETSIVEQDFSVQGISNLYIQGASVYPESFWVNPTFMIMAIADYFVDNILLKDKQ